MIAIIDYGMGNLRSVSKALEFLGYQADVTRDKEKIKNAQKVILPGVGAFGAAIENLRKFELIDTIKDYAKSGRPFMGICLGMQLLMDDSEEQGAYKGLGLIPGKVVKFFQSKDVSPETKLLKVPQMGWNSLQIKTNSPIFKDIPQESMVYFVHSYYVAPDNDDVVAATTWHGIDYCSAISKDNIFATQFHPEKSGSVGLKMLKNFAEVGNCC